MQLLEALTFYSDQLEFMSSSIHGDETKQKLWSGPSYPPFKSSQSTRSDTTSSAWARSVGFQLVCKKNRTSFKETSPRWTLTWERHRSQQNSAQAKNKHLVASMRQQIEPRLWLNSGYKIDQWLARYDRHVSGALVSSCAADIRTSEDSNLAPVLNIKNCAILSFVRTYWHVTSVWLRSGSQTKAATTHRNELTHFEHWVFCRKIPFTKYRVVSRRCKIHMLPYAFNKNDSKAKAIFFLFSVFIPHLSLPESVLHLTWFCTVSVVRPPLTKQRCRAMTAHCDVMMTPRHGVT